MDSEPNFEASLLGPLDAREGPARSLSATELDAAVRAVVDRAMPLRRSLLQRKTVPYLLIAAALSIAGVSVALLANPESFTAGSARALAPLPPMPRAELDHALRSMQRTPAEGSGVSSSTVVDADVRSVSPADLLRTANQLRRQARWADAERTYSRVATSYTNTTEGAIAALAAASLRLEHLGDPRGALRLYQSALRASPLAAEAKLGIAECYRALGDRDAEIQALSRVVAEHPEAMFHARAVSRLSALRAGKPRGN